MKRFLLMLTCLAGIINTYGQVGQAIIEVTKVNRSCIFTKSRIFIKVEVKGASLGVYTAWRSYLEKNLKASIVIPKRAKKGKYKVVVYYIISKDGSLADTRCDNDPGYGICAAAIRIIKKSKSWVPAKQYPVYPYRN